MVENHDQCFVIFTHGIDHYCRTHNVSVCLYIAYIACGSASLYIKTLYFFLTVLALSAAATVANIKIRYDAKIPQFAIFGTCVIYVFYSISWTQHTRDFLIPHCLFKIPSTHSCLEDYLTSVDRLDLSNL